MWITNQPNASRYLYSHWFFLSGECFTYRCRVPYGSLTTVSSSKFLDVSLVCSDDICGPADMIRVSLRQTLTGYINIQNQEICSNSKLDRRKSVFYSVFIVFIWSLDHGTCVLICVCITGSKFCHLPYKHILYLFSQRLTRHTPSCYCLFGCQFKLL